MPETTRPSIKTPLRLRTSGPQIVGQAVNIVTPDETRNAQAFIREGVRPCVDRMVIRLTRGDSSAPGVDAARLFTTAAFGLTVACLQSIGFERQTDPRAQIFELAQSSGSTFEPLKDATVIGPFRTMLNARRLDLGDHHYHALYRQLAALLSDEEELAEASVHPSMVSFAGLMQFLRWNNGTQHPGLSLNQQGRFVASWQPRGRAKLSITFEGLADAHWIAIDRSGDNAARGSGTLANLSTATIDSYFREWLSA